MKVRAMKSQLIHALAVAEKLGSSKHADKTNRNIDITANIYSIRTLQSTKDTVKNFCNWLSDRQKNGDFKDIKLARDLTAEIVQAWVIDRSKNWSEKTLTTHLTNMTKIEKCINNAYSAGLRDLTKFTLPTIEKRESSRVVAMDRADLEEIKNDLSESDRRVNALRAVEIASRCGLRSEEIACLRFDRINLEKMVVEIREGAKNGKSRDVPIRVADLDYFRQLKNNRDHEYVTHGVKSTSLNKAIRDGLKRVGIADKYALTTIHSIRKLYATERYIAEFERCGDQKTAWSIVQAEIGHGDRYRPELFKTYVKI